MKIETLHQYFLESSGVCTDTRKISENCLFFALRGTNYNGNLFAQEALDKGALKVVVDERAYHRPDGHTILVHNSLLSLQELAKYHREHLNLPIIALTGSNGKTTTKELINSVLSQRFRTVATMGNLNNHIGVPLTLLTLNGNTEVGIVEMGANHLGEIKILSEIAQPDFGYITNFGKAHLEGFGSLEGVVKGKTELYEYLKAHDKTIFVNANDTQQLETSKGNNQITFGPDLSHYPIALADSTDTLVVKFEGELIKSNLVGSYNFPNISAAIAIGRYFEMPIEDIKKGIESYTPNNHRSQLMHTKTNTILMDAYNANPSSMMAALENFKQIKGENKIVILGDMFELGVDAEKEHQGIINFLEENRFGKVLVTGSNFYNTQHGSDHIYPFESFESLRAEMEKNPPRHSTILIKGSRGMALERILDLL